MSDFLSSPFSPVMGNLTAGSSAVESALMALGKRESSESKFFRTCPEKISTLQEQRWI